MTYDYPTAFHLWGQEENDAIDRVRASGQWTMGREVAAFEREFADYHGMKYGVMVNSGSSANLVAVASLVSNGDIPTGGVWAPAIAWSTTYAPLVQYGVEFSLVDAGEDWNAVKHSRLSVGCSILGNPAYIDKCLIEDNCESLGATDDRDRLCGTRGKLNTFSFFFSHQLSAIEGGMILTNDSDYAETCRTLRAHGWTRDIKPPKTFDDEYDFVAFGYNVRPVDMHAAVARAQLRKLDNFNMVRRENWDIFDNMTRDIPISKQVQNGKPAPFGLSFTVKDNETRARLVKELRANSIDCRLPTGGSLRLHKYGKRWAGYKTPNADRIHRTGLFLGNAPFDIGDKIERAVKVMREVL